MTVDGERSKRSAALHSSPSPFTAASSAPHRHQLLVQLLDAFLELRDLGLGVGAEAFVFAAQAGHLFVLLSARGGVLLELLAEELHVVLEVLQLLLLHRHALAPVHFLLFVEPLDVHQLGDLREIGIARSHVSSLADALFDLREELAELSATGRRDRWKASIAS